MSQRYYCQYKLEKRVTFGLPNCYSGYIGFIQRRSLPVCAVRVFGGRENGVMDGMGEGQAGGQGQDLDQEQHQEQGQRRRTRVSDLHARAQVEEFGAEAWVVLG